MAITKVHFDFCNRLKRLAGHAVPLFRVDVPKQTEESFTGGRVSMDRKDVDCKTCQGRWNNARRGHCLPNCKGLSDVADLFGVSMTYALTTNAHLWHLFCFVNDIFHW